MTVGSRGIAGIDRIARAAVDAVRRWASAVRRRRDGQPRRRHRRGPARLLAELGVTEAAVGCPIRCEMDTVVLGTNGFGLPIHFDRNAFEADGIVLLNRIKPHTSFTGRYESGLLKMLTIGLGKRQGAAQVHKLGLPGLCKHAPRGRRVPARTDPGGARHRPAGERREQTARVVAVEPEELLDVEPRLLDEARGR